jgi:hypothetical protein
MEGNNVGKTINLASAGEYITTICIVGRAVKYEVNGETFFTYGHAFRAAVAHVKATNTNNMRSN